MIVIVMGVSGSGKTTVAAQLARELGWKFLDADSFHSASNVAKMQAGVPLDDADRAPWLEALRCEIERSLAKAESLAMACSALKRSYREQFLIDPSVKLAYLRGTFEVLRQRLKQRKGHFMTEQLLATQLETLEEPSDAVAVDVEHPIDEIMAEIREHLGLR
jgi:gluconokinase